MFWSVNQQLDGNQIINTEESKLLLKRSEVEISSSESTVGNVIKQCLSKVGFYHAIHKKI